MSVVNNSINSPSVGTTFTLDTGTNTINISNDASATTVNFATGAAAKALTVGSTNTTSTHLVQGGSGTGVGTAAITLATAAAGDIQVGLATQTGAIHILPSTAGGTCNIANAAAANTINIVGSSGTTASTINVGTGAAAHTISIGSTSAGAVSVTSGTTGLTLATGTTGAIGIQPGTTGAVNIGTTSTGNVSIGNTTGTTSIQFGAGSALSTFKDWTAFTPTADGASSGTTTYGTQAGFYLRVGNIVFIQINITFTAATGTGNLVIGGLPFTVNSTAGSEYYGTLRLDGLTWPAGRTQVHLTPQGGGTTALCTASGSAVGAANVQIANTAATIIANAWYRI